MEKVEFKFVDPTDDINKLTSDDKKYAQRVLDTISEEELKEIHQAIRDFPAEEPKKPIIETY